MSFSEASRLANMSLYEEDLCAQGFSRIAGVDEVGRGPLAGPVVAAACILPRGSFIQHLNDSKKLSEKKREDVFEKLISLEGIMYSIQRVEVELIDQINILRASLLAMKRAVESLSMTPDYLLIDGNQLLDLPMPAKAIISGDALSISIAAASVLAKVTRDRWMKELCLTYPQWGFSKHKGYGTKMHLEAIKKHGISPIHRKTFLSKIL